MGSIYGHYFQGLQRKGKLEILKLTYNIYLGGCRQPWKLIKAQLYRGLHCVRKKYLMFTQGCTTRGVRDIRITTLTSSHTLLCSTPVHGYLYFFQLQQEFEQPLG